LGFGRIIPEHKVGRNLKQQTPNYDHIKGRRNYDDDPLQASPLCKITP